MKTIERNINVSPCSSYIKFMGKTLNPMKALEIYIVINMNQHHAFILVDKDDPKGWNDKDLRVQVQMQAMSGLLYVR